MITIRYSLTPEDYAALELERRGGPARRIVRIAFGAFAGFVGVFTIWQAFFFFPWKSWTGNLLLAGMGLLCLWGALEMPGLRWALRKLSDPHAELQIYEGKLAWLSRGKRKEFRWLPKSGFKENERFFLFQARGEDQPWAVPKRAFTPEQEWSLRRLALEGSVPEEVIDCRFFLTQDEVDEASVANQRFAQSKNGRPLMRGICLLSALCVFWLPAFFGKSWTREFSTEPGIAVALIGFGLLSLWAASGCIGLKALNRLDVERIVTLDNAHVRVCCGSRTFNYDWKRMHTFQETARLFVLRTHFLRFWLIPKRSLHSGDEARLRSMLKNKLPENL